MITNILNVSHIHCQKATAHLRESILSGAGGHTSPPLHLFNHLSSPQSQIAKTHEPPSERGWLCCHASTLQLEKEDERHTNI